MKGIRQDKTNFYFIKCIETTDTVTELTHQVPLLTGSSFKTNFHGRPKLRSLRAEPHLTACWMQIGRRMHEEIGVNFMKRPSLRFVQTAAVPVFISKSGSWRLRAVSPDR